MDPAEWRQTVGAMIERARKANGLSKRQAAKAANFDEAVWRQIEQGVRTISGVSVPANPRDDNLKAAALAVGLDPADVFAAAGRHYAPEPEVVLSGSGADLDELARLDPETYEGIMDLARIALDRARDRR